MGCGTTVSRSIMITALLSICCGAVGYRTALVGKCHLQNFVGESPGYEPEAHPASHDAPPEEYAEAMRRRYDRAKYSQELRPEWRRHPDRDVETPYYGFDYVRLCVGHGDNVSGHYEQWLGESSPDTQGRFGAAHAQQHERFG